MHEYSIVQALVDRVEAEAIARGALAADRVVVRVGELSGVDVQLLATAYLTYRVHTVCDHAPLEVAAVPAVWVCRDCHGRLAGGGPLRCAACGGAAVLAQGDEILLDRIELEVPDVREAGPDCRHAVEDGAGRSARANSLG